MKYKYKKLLENFIDEDELGKLKNEFDDKMDDEAIILYSRYYGPK